MPPYRSQTEVEVTPTSVKVKGGITGVVFIILIAFGFWWMQKHEDLVPVQAANDVLKHQLEETAKHIGEPLQNPSTLYEGELGKLVTGIYRDRCIALVAYKPGGAEVLVSKLLSDMLRDTDRHVSVNLSDLFVAILGAQQQASRCDYVNHGPVTKYGEEQRQGYNVLMHYLLADGCEFRQWVDTYHGTQGPRQWIVCRH